MKAPLFHYVKQLWIRKSNMKVNNKFELPQTIPWDRNLTGTLNDNFGKLRFISSCLI